MKGGIENRDPEKQECSKHLHMSILEQQRITLAKCSLLRNASACLRDGENMLLKSYIPCESVLQRAVGSDVSQL